MICHNCKKEFGEIAGYQVVHHAVTWNFCGRICLTEWIAPELKQVAVVKQWVPTEEENERMGQ